MTYNGLQLRRQNMRLGSLLKQFKNNSNGYSKIRYVAKQTVRTNFSDKRQLLKFALLSLIESMRTDPSKFNFIMHGMPSTVVMSKSTTIACVGNSSNYHTNPFSYYSSQNSYAETLPEVLVNEATILYEKMVKDFTNQTIINAAADSSTKLLPSMSYLDEQTNPDI
jgi:hypothetical protein